MREKLLDVIQHKILLGDGAAGTYLYQLGFPVGISYEQFNMTKPHIITQLHQKYYEAGARLIETNTYSANREKLEKYGLANEVQSINRAAVRIAREAVGEDAYVVGAVGSIRDERKHHLDPKYVLQNLQEQISILLEEQVDAIMLETFFDVEEISMALQFIREESNIPVLCQLAVEDATRMMDGMKIDQAFLQLMDEGADMIGLNCRSGPQNMKRTLQYLYDCDVTGPFSIFPNAGKPDYVDGKYEYVTSPQYFADQVLPFVQYGARIVGGCCGTTPEHIAAMKAAIDDIDLDQLHAPAPQLKKQPLPLKVVSKSEGDHHQPTIVDIVKERHAVIVELDPPKDLDIDKFLAGTKALKEAGVDALTMADNSLAVTRMSNMALATIVKEKYDIRPLVHIACRDRNLIGTQSHMMGFDALDIDHVLAVTGDPARFGDLPGASSVYDLNSFEIIRMIKQLNEGTAFSGKPLKQKANFVIGAAFNPHVKHLHKAIERLEKKVECGADYIMTQPIYDAALIEELHESTKHLDVPIFVGIAPLASGGNAEYLHNEVPGIQLSDEVRQRMAGLRGEEGRAAGVKIAEELLDVAMPLFNGIYLMTPFLAYDMTVALTNYVWKKTKRFDLHLSK
ncbi:bifunctional homocysteine S-methyltransferase/methylenetetrahydrofolate reductase [Longirhabdus pacifica]|uniref:bifunctional homocysteine S-methyltransferase/methylenetetrahydrofolate reductase n=1 Tax=Longirhabdus pacifica TaxID=2305227 RepID=UPI001008698D|nr:bifunctional homocysteine S-methyltransferase/methylenetetrahydrofolate reductase [Longirhabdus pacifica]